MLVVGALLASRHPGRRPAGPKPEDLKSSVPALDAMHEVIMPLWHDAWPNKDVKAMAAMLPDIEKHVAAVNEAQLPPCSGTSRRPGWPASTT